MTNLCELNNTVLGSLKLKYMILKLTLDNNIDCKSLNITSRIPDELEMVLDFTHELLETYIDFKEELKDVVVPNTISIPHELDFAGDIIYDSLISENLTQNLGFTITTNYCELNDLDEESHFKLIQKLKNFDDLDLDFLLSYSSYIHYNQSIILHPLIDKFIQSKDADKLKHLINFLNSHKYNLAQLFIPPLADQINHANYSITSVEQLKTRHNFKQYNFYDFKYAIVLEYIEEEESGASFDYSDSLYSFLNLYKLLVEGTSKSKE